ncbi:MAG: serine hydrolase [Saprospiraceae bacterium]|nr:serine hydrolase [Saprospiraceae bacterium]
MFTKTLRSLWFAVAFSCLVLPGRLIAQTPVDASLAALLQEKLDSCVNNFNLPGISATILFPNNRVWQSASGLSHIYNQTPMDTSRLFFQASVTKMLVSALVLKLVDEGELSLDDSIGQYLPVLPHVKGAIKVRNLLNHRSGIHDFLAGNSASSQSWFTTPFAIWDPEDAISTYIQAPYFPENAGFQYSNTNYILLGMIVENITGVTFATALHERFLEPYGLNRTYFVPEDFAPGPFATGWTSFSAPNVYNTDAAPLFNACSYSMIFTAGALIAKPADIARFTRLLYTGEILSDSMMNVLKTCTNVNLGNGCNGYGHGSMRYSFSGKTYFGHAGDFNGFTQLSIHQEEDGITLTISINRNNAPRGPIAAALLQVVRDNPLTTSVQEAAPVIKDLIAMPNPVKGRTQVSGKLTKGGNCQLELLDFTGRALSTQQLGYLSPGVFEYPLDVTGLPAGVYSCRLIHETGSASVQLIVS